MLYFWINNFKFEKTFMLMVAKTGNIFQILKINLCNISYFVLINFAFVNNSRAFSKYKYKA